MYFNFSFFVRNAYAFLSVVCSARYAVLIFFNCFIIVRVFKIVVALSLGCFYCFVCMDFTAIV